MDDITTLFLNINAKAIGGSFRPNKPLLLLLALSRCRRDLPRLAPFSEYESDIQPFRKLFGDVNLVFPFGRLITDNLWEIPQWDDLYKNSSGDLLRSELIQKCILGGFPARVYSALKSNLNLLDRATRVLVDNYFAEDQRAFLYQHFPITGQLSLDIDGPSLPIHDSAEPTTSPFAATADRISDEPLPSGANGFVFYLNSLHNLKANGSNALAESQALNPYFSELYEPLPLTSHLISLLTDGSERVVILTGHAGDGKSSMAMHVVKELRGIPLGERLSIPLRPREDIAVSTGTVSVIKDVSELAAEVRAHWIDEAIRRSGSWLIVSNTGPLLDTLQAYARNQGLDNLESRILEILNEPVSHSAIKRHSIDCFDKEVLVLNLTRFDNTDLGALLLRKLVQHSGWEECSTCPTQSACPLALNRQALASALPVVEERVRWIYRRINDYEQRLTLRQIVAQLAFGITGGLDCNEARARVEASTALGTDRGTATLEEILFSEGFFGCSSAKPRPEADALRAIALLRRTPIGGPVGADFERSLIEDRGGGWAALPDALDHLAERWRNRAIGADALQYRAALRRMLLIFGIPRQEATERSQIFLDAMLRSPSLRQLDAWQRNPKSALSRAEAKWLRTACLNVLLESYSGFCTSQFRGRLDRLYITLRRPDRAVIQPTQLILASLPFSDFDLILDPVSRLPQLRYRVTSIVLELSLPLLDYIRRRDAGELADALSPIQQAQLDQFAARLLRAQGDSSNTEEVGFLRASIDGEVVVYRYFLDEQKQNLERE